MLNILDAKKLIGKTCVIEWKDRSGNIQQCTSIIYDATFVPLYGGYLMTAQEDIRLDRLVSIHILEESPAAHPEVATSPGTEKLAA